MDWTQVIWGLLLMLGGALLSYLVTVFINNWWFKRKTALMGVWRSRYISLYGQHDWVEEDVKITSSRGGICFKSDDNPDGDHYVAYAELVPIHNLMGRWESTVSANAKGALLLTINPLEDIMFGYFVGRDRGGRIFYGPWVLAKKDNEKDQQKQLVEGFSLLKETSHNIDPLKYLSS